MVYNEIGKTGMRVSNLSFGASSLGGVFHGIREEEGIRAVHTAVDNGINFIDVRLRPSWARPSRRFRATSIISPRRWDATARTA